MLSEIEALYKALPESSDRFAKELLEELSPDCNSLLPDVQADGQEVLLVRLETTKPSETEGSEPRLGKREQ